MQSRYSEARKIAALTEKCPKNAFGEIWSSVGFQLFIGKQSILADHSPIAWEKFKYHNFHQGFNWEHPTDEKEILSRCRECWEDLLNPVRATLTDICYTIDFGKEEGFTLTEVAAAIREMKSGKAAGEDEIRHEILKTIERWSALVDTGVSGGVETWKNTKRLADKFYHSYISYKKSDSK